MSKLETRIFEILDFSFRISDFGFDPCTTQSTVRLTIMTKELKTFFKKYIGFLFVSPRLYAALICCIALFVLRFFFKWIGDIPYLAFMILLILVGYDYILLFGKRKGIFAVRSMAERLSNGDDNEIRIDIENFYPFTVQLEVIDEVPHQFQKRDVLFKLSLRSGSKKNLHYALRPVKRGSYEFGVINVYAKTS